MNRPATILDKYSDAAAKLHRIWEQAEAVVPHERAQLLKDGLEIHFSPRVSEFLLGFKQQWLEIVRTGIPLADQDEFLAQMEPEWLDLQRLLKGVHPAAVQAKRDSEDALARVTSDATMRREGKLVWQGPEDHSQVVDKTGNDR